MCVYVIWVSKVVMLGAWSALFRRSCHLRTSRPLRIFRSVACLLVALLACLRCFLCVHFLRSALLVLSFSFPDRMRSFLLSVIILFVLTISGLLQSAQGSPFKNMLFWWLWGRWWVFSVCRTLRFLTNLPTLSFYFLFTEVSLFSDFLVGVWCAVGWNALLKYFSCSAFVRSAVSSFSISCRNLGVSLET